MASLAEALSAIRAPRAKPETQAERARKFRASWAWRKLRYRVLLKRGRRCECCGARAGEPGVVLSVDHIRPISTHWELRLREDNCQVLCMDCNQGKSNLDDTDFRTDAEAESGQ